MNDNDDVSHGIECHHTCFTPAAPSCMMMESAAEGEIGDETFATNDGIADLLVERILAMKEREADYQSGDYLNRLGRTDSDGTKTTSGEVPESPPVDVECRSRMCEWAFSVVDNCQYQRQTVGVAMNLLDRFLDAADWALADRSAFQLAAITSLYTAIKIGEPSAISVATMAVLSRGKYTAPQIEAMERVLLDTDRWLLHPPTAGHFGRAVAEWLARRDGRYHLEPLLELIDVQLDAAVADYRLCCCGDPSVTPSVVALCAVQNAMEGMNVTSEWEQRQVLERLSGLLIGEVDIVASPINLLNTHSTFNGNNHGAIGCCEGLHDSNRPNCNERAVHDINDSAKMIQLVRTRLYELLMEVSAVNMKTSSWPHHFRCHERGDETVGAGFTGSKVAPTAKSGADVSHGQPRSPNTVSDEVGATATAMATSAYNQC